MNYEIKSLPENVISKLRSGVNIASAAQCVEELILNSVDAKATCIAVRLDLNYRKIQVVDNGIGIEKNQFASIAERYHTSKCHNLHDLTNLGHYGFRGEALASLRELSGALVIESRFRGCGETYCKTFFCKTSQKPKISKCQAKRPSTGTTVTILDFMHNLPVRKSLICPVRDLEQCKERIQAVALMHPHINFSLRNDSTGEMSLQTKKCKDLMGIFQTLYGIQKGLTAKIVQHKQDNFEVWGLICTDGHYSKDLQFLYINKRLVLKTRLHHILNCVIGKRLSSRNSAQSTKHPVFVLNLKCPLNSYDITFEPSKTLVEFENWDPINRFFEEFLEQFVLEHFGSERKDRVSDRNNDVVVERLIVNEVADVRHSLHSLPAIRNGVGKNEETRLKTIEKNESQPRVASKSLPYDVDSSGNKFYTPVNQIIRTEPQIPPKTTSSDSPEAASAFDCSLHHFVKRFKLVPKVEKTWKLPDPTPKIEKIQTSNRPTDGGKTVHFNLDLNVEISDKEFEETDLHSPLSTSTEPFTVLSPVTDENDRFTSPTDDQLKDTNDSDYAIAIAESEPFCTTQPFEVDLASASDITNRSGVSNSMIKDCNRSRYFDVTERTDTDSVSKVLKNCSEEITLSTKLQFPRLWVEDDQRGINTKDKFRNSASNSASRPLIRPTRFAFHSQKSLDNITSNHNSHQNIESSPENGLTVDASLPRNPEVLSPTVASDSEPSLDIVPNTPTWQLIIRNSKPENTSHGSMTKAVQCTLATRENATTFKDHSLSPTVTTQRETSLDTCPSTPSSQRVISDSKSSPTTPGKQLPNIEGQKQSSEELFTSGLEETEAKEDLNTSDSVGSWMSQWQSLEDQLDSLFEKMEGDKSSRQNEMKELTKIETKEDSENPDKGDSSGSWKSCLDPESRSVLYINKNTGNSSFKLPERKMERLSGADLQKPKHYFLSHDSSPFQPRPDRKIHNRDKDNASDVSNVLREWDNPVFERSDSKEINDLSWELFKDSESLAKVQRSFGKFHKTMLKNIQVIGQIDDKFIACLIKNEENDNLLVLFDQHAVHERIRLEHLTRELYIGDKIMKYIDIIPPLVLNLGGEWVRLARAYRDELKKLGINLLFNCANVEHLSVTTAPPSIIERESNTLKRGRSTTLETNLTDLIMEQLNKIKNKTMGPSLPSTLQNILNSQACRGAIKFGDKLNIRESKELILGLNRCQLPFQCAHGRPSMVPLLNFANLKEFPSKKKPPSYENLRKN